MLGEKIIEKLKEEIPQIEYERYIKNLRYDEKRSKVDHAVFIAPNLFVANWVKRKYSKKLSQLFELETGVETFVEITTKKEPSIKKLAEKKPEINQPTTSTKINPTYTFENFVVGSSNQFAYTAAHRVAEKPGEVYNPLYIYGGTGLGKTHLLHAIGNFNLKKSKTIIYATIEQFMNDFTYHLRQKTIENFREKYRKCDILLIDDIQFLSGKEGTQEEFFHTFNELHTDGKQIVLTSDQPPKKIAGLEERLKSRFEWGLIADIQPPELETKIAIIKKKCELNGIQLEDEIVNYLAANMDSNIREIEGIILKLNAYSTLVNQEITMELAKNVLNEQKREQQKEISLKEIVDVVANELNIKPSEIKSKSRNRQIVNARRIVIYLARNLTPNSMPSLAQFFGMKDHTSVSHAMKKVKELMEKDANFKVQIDELLHKIKHANSE
ncbi:chromosomal replication initiator protein [Nitratiruptor sp. YY08-26]|uniref:Chromosomal replication initiator protein DnaA n=1 Tax=Nitratiruptor tergarcus DSM 16512 TaxID=1069081 RepID=A0A1W1WQT7_9BACT|nr:MULTISPECIES: chromosomal replication initiator protein DnaA [Nitratiruptor]BCD61168.1 chromosomal replication initiator protein [Nitratiruptor sp. YY08-13]BCD65101.1 chromosomal replication initiator protein [Nitratiruptor sp. YY08-26]SMC08678.1 chromosomal replication initiator protein DnaA [Nitratiruptor tergarcus DSM 16512]